MLYDHNITGCGSKQVSFLQLAMYTSKQIFTSQHSLTIIIVSIIVSFVSPYESTVSSTGWRPSFRYYWMWLSFIGAVLCLAVMFVINWWTALITLVIVTALYLYVHYRKPGNTSPLALHLYHICDVLSVLHA